MANPILEALGIVRSHPEGLNPQQLVKFIRAARKGKGPRNKYVDIGPYSIYTQIGPYGYGGEKDLWLNIGNISNTEKVNLPSSSKQTNDPSQRGPQGRFKELMQLVEQTAAKEGLGGVYVEQVQNEFLPQVLRRYGYVPADRIGERSYRKTAFSAGKMEPHRSDYSEEGSTHTNETIARSVLTRSGLKPFGNLSDEENSQAIFLAQKITSGQATIEDHQRFADLLDLDLDKTGYEDYLNQQRPR